MIIKDFLKMGMAVLGDVNLTANEKTCFQGILYNFNYELGYSYPDYDTLKMCMSTNRNDTVSNALTNLAELGYIRIEKHGRKNIYYVLRGLYDKDDTTTVEQISVRAKRLKSAKVSFKPVRPIKDNVELIEPIMKEVEQPVKPVAEVKPVKTVKPVVKPVVEEVKPVKEVQPIVVEHEEIEEVQPVADVVSCSALEELRALSKAPVDSDGKKPMEGQVHISDVDVEVSKELKETTGFNDTQVAELLAVADNKKALVLQAYDYTINTGNVANKFGYTKKMIMVFKNNGKSSEVYFHNSHDKALRFNNFEARSYDYDKLEKGLLGWTDSETYEDCCINPVAN